MNTLLLITPGRHILLEWATQAFCPSPRDTQNALPDPSRMSVLRIPHAGDMMQVHQHLVAATSPARVPMIEYLPWGLEVFDDPVELTRGTITLPSKPGASSSIAKDARQRWQE